MVKRLRSPERSDIVVQHVERTETRENNARMGGFRSKRSGFYEKEQRSRELHLLVHVLFFSSFFSSAFSSAFSSSSSQTMDPRMETALSTSPRFVEENLKMGETDDPPGNSRPLRVPVLAST